MGNLKDELKKATSGSKATDKKETTVKDSTKAADATTETTGGKKKGKGKTKKNRVRAKLTDAKKAWLTVIRTERPDGQWTVNAVHVAKEGEQAKTGMVNVLPNELAATKRFDEIVELAKKAGWIVVVGKGTKELKNEFTTIPTAAR